jgi:hypothetical protein
MATALPLRRGSLSNIDITYKKWIWCPRGPTHVATLWLRLPEGQAPILPRGPAPPPIVGSRDIALITLNAQLPTPRKGINTISSARHMKSKYQNMVSQHLVSSNVCYRGWHRATLRTCYRTGDKPTRQMERSLPRTVMATLKSLVVMIIPWVSFPLV